MLELIDITGTATNNGVLVQLLEEHLGGVCVANATLGLDLACRYVFGNSRRAVRVPAFTFPATVLAVINAGFEPVLCDVNLDTWAAEPDDRTLSVCPFGYPAEGPLVDAAAAYGRALSGNYVMSLHATKPLPAGEGGVVCGSPELLDYVRRARNFGFEDYLVEAIGTNAKMSEYHAAVALASLERYPAANERRGAIAKQYADKLGTRLYALPYGGGMNYPVLVDDPVGLQRRLSDAAIASRRWYCPTLDQHPAFRGLRRESLKNAHYLASRLICLPFHVHMHQSDIDRVCEVVCAK